MAVKGVGLRETAVGQEGGGWTPSLLHSHPFTHPRARARRDGGARALVAGYEAAEGLAPRPCILPSSKP